MTNIIKLDIDTSSKLRLENKKGVKLPKTYTIVIRPDEKQGTLEYSIPNHVMDTTETGNRALFEHLCKIIDSLMLEDPTLEYNFDTDEYEE